MDNASVYGTEDCSGQDSYTYYTDVQEPQRDDTVKPKKVPDFFPKTVMSINNGRLVKVERVSGSICGIEDSYMLDAEDMATAVKVIQAMNLTRSEVNRISEYADSFDVASILDAIYPHVFQLDEKTQSRALQLLQDYGPPESLVRAVQSLTMEQKGHIQELRHKKRLGEVKVITRGIIFSLPDEDQLQARKFVAALRFMFDYDKAMTY
ncbi:unnamed protein product [Bursaphelenchus okinawaensis]|uniref:Uncharacterized protein n=1 Tax=Bursaphelenchus okinawaensis TaxID=465554 RepID=A0A811KKG2_9BILA|nr:unnamed protein product [Bursaphelenchus okinawaensis]CAG9105552.1 unnamed protein product [Bursaphelenchus okinawaensis]